jgi:hypothetical protein
MYGFWMAMEAILFNHPKHRPEIFRGKLDRFILRDIFSLYIKWYRLVAHSRNSRVRFSFHKYVSKSGIVTVIVYLHRSAGFLIMCLLHKCWGFLVPKCSKDPETGHSITGTFRLPEKWLSDIRPQYIEGLRPTKITWFPVCKFKGRP